MADTSALTCGKCEEELGAMYYSSVPAYGSVCIPCHNELYAPLPEKTLIIDGVVSAPETPAPPDPPADRLSALESRVAELRHRQTTIIAVVVGLSDRMDLVEGRCRVTRNVEELRDTMNQHERVGGDAAPVVTLEEFNKHSAPIGPGPCSPLGCRCVLGPNSPIQPQCDQRGAGPGVHCETCGAAYGAHFVGDECSLHTLARSGGRSPALCKGAIVAQ